jgi:hypothetical protein
LRPGKASEKTPKGVIPPSLCEISQNASRKKIPLLLSYLKSAARATMSKLKKSFSESGK